MIKNKIYLKKYSVNTEMKCIRVCPVLLYVDIFSLMLLFLWTFSQLHCIYTSLREIDSQQCIM